MRNYDNEPQTGGGTDASGIGGLIKRNKNKAGYIVAAVVLVVILIAAIAN